MVAEARLAWNDERGYASTVVPGFGLDELFGAREKLIRPEAEPKMLLSGLLPGQTALGAAFEEHLQALPGAQVLATFPSGDAAIVQKTYGHGKAILAGSFLGLAYQRKHDASTRALLLALAESAAVPPVSVSGADSADVEVRRLIADGHQFVFVFNHGNESGDCGVEVRLPWRPRVARDLVTGEEVPMGHRDARHYDAVLHRPLPKDAIWVIKLERE